MTGYGLLLTASEDSRQTPTTVFHPFRATRLGLPLSGEGGKAQGVNSIQATTHELPSLDPAQCLAGRGAPA